MTEANSKKKVESNWGRYLMSTFGPHICTGTHTHRNTHKHTHTEEHTHIFSYKRNKQYGWITIKSM